MISTDATIMAGMVSHGSVERRSVVRCWSSFQEIGWVRGAECWPKSRDGEPCRKRLAQSLAQSETPRERLLGTDRQQGIDVDGDRDEGRVFSHPWGKRSGVVLRR